MSAPGLTVVTVPGCAGVGAAPAPEAEGCVAPSAWAYTSSTPRHEDIQRPPSGTESWRSATIARTSSPLGLARGMFWTLVATNVAIEMPPAETENRSGSGARAGPTESLHAAASRAAARILGRTLTVVRSAGRGVIARC